MSRKTIFKSDNITLVGGYDTIIGWFYQLYDEDLCNETPEGEGIIVEWSSAYGLENNLTEYSNELDVKDIITNYIKESTGVEDIDFNFIFKE